MSTRTALALVGVIIILGLGVFLLRRPAEAPTTSGAPPSSALPPANVPPANPTLLPPPGVPPAGSAPAPSLPPPGNQPVANPAAPPPIPPTTSGTTPAGALTIRIMASGFSPATVSVAQGTRVTFRNESSGDSWPASAMHPTHKLYPGSDILKCSTTEKNAIFDACGDVAPGASWSFTMSERGSWKYHDHLSPSRTGTIVVE